ncbi:MAG: hypothetical protein JSR96_11615 [Proteobacteria bacterium]|nr:hypothetical protein [Pseudomonadota bacterium]
MPLLPPANELQFLLGKEISSIIFGSSGVHFVWCDGGEIHAMRDFDHTDQGGVRHQFGNGMRFDPPSLLHRLVQRKVTALDVNENSFILTFDDGQALVFHAQAGNGENGLIQLGSSLSDDYIVW